MLGRTYWFRLASPCHPAPSWCLVLRDNPSQFHFFASLPQGSEGIIRPGQGKERLTDSKYPATFPAPGKSALSQPREY